MNLNFEQFLISDNQELLDLPTIKSFLSRSYWANNRPEERIERSIHSSVCYGIYEDQRQIGFARIVTDEATMYWLCDVFIDEEYRGKGLGKKLVETITRSERFKDLTGILATRDAHELYEQYHFIKDGERFMRRTPDYIRNK
ncbi:GNAT family N-acetyltransferase [Paenibacillus beijingensis]|uniref:GCN5 family acetyltransferase n=1 Tax=Paenibacillus beijingensis TaxID=1126833 RepID=A0A0D5NLJ7_9BACL|nr:GNAT family N-acetyltransferase [Paenibacillus beijingensis]AJY76194.1 GCN5 family acetyltransferase [Paenibacillus beijingensis]